EAGLARVQTRQLHRAFDRVRAVADEEAALQVAGRQLADQLGERAAQRVEQLLRGERHALELRLHGAHDLGMSDACRVDAVPAQAVDELPACDVLEERSLAAPLDRGGIASL